MKTTVQHWRYDDGWYTVPLAILQQRTGNEPKEYRPEVVGWHCWVFPDNDGEFVAWMDENMSGYTDCTFRFNNGNPMFTVHIRDPEDAIAFKLKWL